MFTQNDYSRLTQTSVTRCVPIVTCTLLAITIALGVAATGPLLKGDYGSSHTYVGRFSMGVLARESSGRRPTLNGGGTEIADVIPYKHK